MNGKQIAGEIRGWCDFIAGWLWWLAAFGLLLIFAASVARAWRFAVPYIPTLSETALLYLAGAAYLLRR